jgi:hypothetical protein
MLLSLFLISLIVLAKKSFTLVTKVNPPSVVSDWLNVSNSSLAFINSNTPERLTAVSTVTSSTVKADSVVIAVESETILVFFFKLASTFCKLDLSSRSFLIIILSLEYVFNPLSIQS